jgi:predicted amidohydrolase
MTLDRYVALALQTRCDAVNGCSTRVAARAQMKASVGRIGGHVTASKQFIGADVKLVVLPEYFLTGFPMQESIGEWRDKACLAMDDEIYHTLGELAQKNAVFIAGNAYECDPHFPALYFQTSFVIADNGDLVLRYRRLISLYAPSPHDVWDDYLQHYGIDGVFPVACTAIGNLAAIASEEILYPEIARAHALRGAEIFLHSSSEIGSSQSTIKHVAKTARAFENLAFTVSANSAGIVGTPIPSQSTDGMSCVVDYRGITLVQAGFGESMVAHASIDLAALRAYRRRPGMGNLLARQRRGLFADVYAKGGQAPANTLDGTIEPNKAHFRTAQQSVIATLSEQGLI